MKDDVRYQWKITTPLSAPMMPPARTKALMRLYLHHTRLLLDAQVEWETLTPITLRPGQLSRTLCAPDHFFDFLA